MRLSIFYARSTAFALFLVSAVANAAVVNINSVPLTIGPNSVSFDANGIGVTAEGYHVEYEPTDGSTIIYGPVSTSETQINFDFFPNFGRPTRFDGSPIIRGSDPLNRGLGLSMTLTQDLGQTENDFVPPGFSGGFDSFLDTAGSLPSLQFALFRFDDPIDLSQILVSSTGNLNKSLWAAGGTVAPNLSQDLPTALNGYTVVNAQQDNPNDFQTYDIAPLLGISYLMIGTPPRSDSIGDLGSLVGGEPVSFFIDGLDITSSSVSPPNPVPVPAAAWLFGTALIGLVGFSKRRKAA